MHPNYQTSTHTKTKGAVLLALVFIMLISLTLLIFALSRAGQFEQKITGNTYQKEQAFAAAEAGLDFGIVYLAKNSSAILVNNGSGYLASYTNTNTTNVSLSNGSQYTITYSNPTQNNFNLITVTSDGTSADGSATAEVREQVDFSPTLTHYSNYPAVIRGNISMAGNSSITNTQYATNIQAGGSITFNSNSGTYLSTGIGSTSHEYDSDVSQNVTSLQNTSLTNFFATYFGGTTSSVQSSVTYYYQNSSNTNYDSQLNGVTGSSIWLEQTGSTTATLDSTTVIGSSTNPVILIVNGNLNLAGNVVINGFVYVMGNVQTAGNSTINGALVVGGNASDTGNYALTFNSSILQKLQQKLGTFGKVSGSWNDFKQ